MKKNYRFDKDGRKDLVSEEFSAKELDMKHKHSLKYMPLWIILVLGVFILLLALAVNLTADANTVELSCKVEGLHRVPTYNVFLNELDYMPVNMDCTYKGPMPK